MISEYIDSFDEFYKLDLSFSEFYSQHYGDYRHMDCEVGNPFEIFDGNGHKIREKRIERIERENICFVGIKKKVQYAPIGETLVQRKARRKEDFEKYMNAGCGSESMEQLDDGGAAYASEIIEIPQYDINKIEIPDFVAESYFDGRKFYYEIYFEMDIDGENEVLEIMLDSKRNMVDQLKKKFNEFSKKSKKLTGEYKKIHPYLLELLGDYFTGVCEYRTFYLIDSNITVGWEGTAGRRIYVKYLERINNKSICQREEDFQNVSQIETLNRKSDKLKLNGEIFERYCKMFADPKYNLEQACAYRDLLTALRQFATFVHSHWPEFEPLMRDVLLKAEEIATEEALDCEIKMQQRKNNKQNTSKVRKNDVIKKFFDIVLKELELNDTYIIDEGGDFLFIDYKQFQKCYGDGNYKSFLATCRDIELLEVPKRANNGKFRGYAFDKMKNGKKYKVLKVNRKFYDKYCKMTQESKK